MIEPWATLDLEAQSGAESRVLELLRAELRQLVDVYIAAEERLARMAELYAALSRLHSAGARAEALGALREIVTTFAAAEAFALLELVPNDGALSLSDSVGIDPAPWHRVELEGTRIGEVVRSGTPFFRDSPPDPPATDGPGIVACVPLLLRGQPTGALVIFRLHPPRTHLGTQELRALSLVGRHAAVALHHASLEERLLARPDDDR